MEAEMKRGLLKEGSKLDSLRLRNFYTEYLMTSRK